MAHHDDFKLSERLEAVLALDPNAVAIEYQGQSIRWGELARAADQIEGLLREAGIEKEAPVGWTARNRPSAVASFIALIRNGLMVVPLRPMGANFKNDIVA